MQVAELRAEVDAVPLLTCRQGARLEAGVLHRRSTRTATDQRRRDGEHKRQTERADERTASQHGGGLYHGIAAKLEAPSAPSGPRALGCWSAPGEPADASAAPLFGTPILPTITSYLCQNGLLHAVLFLRGCSVLDFRATAIPQNFRLFCHSMTE